VKIRRDDVLAIESSEWRLMIGFNRRQRNAIYSAWFEIRELAILAASAGQRELSRRLARRSRDMVRALSRRGRTSTTQRALISGMRKLVRTGRAVR
jgi:hypothetical protein